MDGIQRQGQRKSRRFVWAQKGLTSVRALSERLDLSNKALDDLELLGSVLLGSGGGLLELGDKVVPAGLGVGAGKESGSLDDLVLERAVSKDGNKVARHDVWWWCWRGGGSAEGERR